MKDYLRLKDKKPEARSAAIFAYWSYGDGRVVDAKGQPLIGARLQIQNHHLDSGRQIDGSWTRVMTDRGQEFDKIPAGYDGPLWLEVSPRKPAKATSGESVAAAGKAKRRKNGKKAGKRGGKDA